MSWALFWSKNLLCQFTFMIAIATENGILRVTSNQKYLPNETGASLHLENEGPRDSSTQTFTTNDPEITTTGSSEHGALLDNDADTCDIPKALSSSEYPCHCPTTEEDIPIFYAHLQEDRYYWIGAAKTWDEMPYMMVLATKFQRNRLPKILDASSFPDRMLPIKDWFSFTYKKTIIGGNMMGLMIHPESSYPQPQGRILLTDWRNTSEFDEGLLPLMRQESLEPLLDPTQDAWIQAMALVPPVHRVSIFSDILDNCEFI